MGKCIMYRDITDCDKATCTGCGMRVEMITVEAVFGCGHKSNITTTIDDAGPDVAMAINELCPSCERQIFSCPIGRC